MKARYTYHKNKTERKSECCGAVVLLRHKRNIEKKIHFHELQLICSKCRKHVELSEEIKNKIKVK